MSDPTPSPETWILQATEALESGDNQLAIHLARQALESGPPSESAYLILAGAVSDPEESLRYLNLALEINPKSRRARDGMRWALRLQRAQKSAEAEVSEVGDKEDEHADGPASAAIVEGAEDANGTEAPGDTSMQSEGEPGWAGEWMDDGGATLPGDPGLLPEDTVESTAPRDVDETGPVFTQPLSAQARKRASRGTKSDPAGSVGLSGALLAVLPWLAALLVGAIGLGIWIFSGTSGILKPGWIFGSPTSPPTVSIRTATATFEALVATPTSIELIYPTTAATESEAPVVTATPQLSATAITSNTPEIPVVEITPISALPPAYEPPANVYVPPSTDYTPSNGQHWIDINLSTQRAYAYDGDSMVREFIVSTGTWQYPTITGQFFVYIKFVADDMSGPGYYLPDVPYVQYFYKDYALHGTYWHNNFGTPMSHGCINFTTADSAWVFDWIGIGDLVNIHY